MGSVLVVNFRVHILLEQAQYLEFKVGEVLAVGWLWQFVIEDVHKTAEAVHLFFETPISDQAEGVDETFFMSDRNLLVEAYPMLVINHLILLSV